MRFELTVPFDTTVFKTVAISRTLPRFLLLVPRERLELSILAAVASKTTVYTIPPPGHINIILTINC